MLCLNPNTTTTTKPFPTRVGQLYGLYDVIMLCHVMYYVLRPSIYLYLILACKKVTRVFNSVKVGGQRCGESFYRCRRTVTSCRLTTVEVVPNIILY